MEESLLHFVIVFDTRGEEPPTISEFTDEMTALSRYEAEERQHRDEGGRGVVLVSSDSLQTVKATHGNLWGAANDTWNRLVRQVTER